MTGFNKMENLISKSTSGIISTQEIFAENISREILNKFIENGELTTESQARSLRTSLSFTTNPAA